jgi:hypothetical protein
MRTETDLEVLVTLLELGAIHLTSKPDDAFTAEQLFEAARYWCIGSDFTIADTDLKIILPHCKFLKHERGMLQLR